MEIPKNTGSITIPGREGETFDYLSTTPGGTIYGTTPGGTKIKYTRDALLFIRNSPLSKTPPSNLPLIPGITAPGSLLSQSPNSNNNHLKKGNNNNNTKKSPKEQRKNNNQNNKKTKETKVEQPAEDESDEVFAMD